MALLHVKLLWPNSLQTLNRNAYRQIVWPAGFSLSPAFVIPTINITPSMATDQQSAMLAVCTQIIAGLKLSNPYSRPEHCLCWNCYFYTTYLRKSIKILDKLTVDPEKMTKKMSKRLILVGELCFK